MISNDKILKFPPRRRTIRTFDSERRRRFENRRVLVVDFDERRVVARMGGSPRRISRGRTTAR